MSTPIDTSVAQAAGEPAASGAEADVPGRSPAEIVTDDARWEGFDGLAVELERAVDAACRAAGRNPDEVSLSLALANDAGVQVLNSRYRGADKPTNVLSFPAPAFASDPESGEPAFLGDVILSFDTIEREAAADGKTFRDHAMHLAVHGALHLLGFTHESDDDAEKMERLEVEVLSTFGITNPYADHGRSTADEPDVLRH